MADLSPPGVGLVLVGVIARPHGLRGHVVVNPETDFAADRFAPGAEVLVRVNGRLAALTVSSLRFTQGRPIVGFEGFDVIEAVAALAQQPVWIREADRAPLEPGRYYHSDLVGCVVETVRGGARVGEVTRVEQAGGVPLLVVDAGGHEVLIPLAEAICREVDPAHKRIVVDPPDGLLELNERKARSVAGDE